MRRRLMTDAEAIFDMEETSVCWCNVLGESHFPYPEREVIVVAAVVVADPLRARKEAGT